MSTRASSFNLADLVESVADTVPERIALSCSERRLTYQQLDERATRLANSWRELGIGQSDHIGLQLRNGSEYIEGMLAAYKLRAVPININFHYVEGELEYLYNDADLVALVTHQAFAPKVAQVLAMAPELKYIFCVADSSAEEVDSRFIDYEQALAESTDARNFSPRDSNDLYIVYTGGTTGMPKGVMWHHRDIFFAAMGGGDPTQALGPIADPAQLIERIPEQPLTILTIPPFMHAAAQWSAFTALTTGGKIVIPPGGNFDPPAIWQSVSEEQVLMIVLVGDAMATPLADSLAENPGRWDISSLAVIASGGALFSPSTKERLLEYLPHVMILDGLGASETGLMGSKVGADDREPRFMVNPHMTVLDENNQVLEPGCGKMGFLARRGHVPIGYYKAPEKSAKTFVEVDGERWAIPGDLATVEADGTIFLHGRGSVSINTGGEKVFPEEVESQLKEHGDVLDAVVVGLDDDRFGQKVVAVCQTRSGDDLKAEELRDFCRGKLANYKMPREVVCLAKIKRSPAGKADYPWAVQMAQQVLG